ncbi:MAG: Uma2 family endonuclease [Armatimonadetes bacterium]|nr:Uma2 family endonuclease [Armatimonadota bacterium]
MLPKAEKNRDRRCIALALTHAKTHRFTVAEFERLHQMDVFGKDARVELIEGEVVEMPPMNTPHGNGVMHSNQVLGARFGDTHWVRVQSPLNLSSWSQPEPDLALVPRGYDQSSHPTSADLIVEVSDTSLYDRDEKASLYAMAGIPELWIVNVLDRCLEVLRNPERNLRKAFGFHYATWTTHNGEDRVAPLLGSDRAVLVADLLGPVLPTAP